MSSEVIKRADPTDDYELLQRVGSGTYGEVYKARHIRTHELSAVKVVKLEAGDNFSVIQQEIMMIRDCVHPNIIAYYGSYLRRDRLWIVMEYCGGGSLQDIYHMTGPLSELQIAFVCRETLKGLDYLHKMGKVHRDIKGANILLSDSGDVKLADFGVAAQITATIGKRKSFIGTPYWMAPEVACVERRGGYGVQCDVWAVGITAIEFAECQPPLFDLHPMQVLYLMTKSNYKSPHLKDKYRWSPLFHDFVHQCLTKNPKKRPLPEKLLEEHHFLLGSLSSRMTRDLLDKVNNGGARAPPVNEEPEEVSDEEDKQKRRFASNPTFKVDEAARRRHRPAIRPPEPPLALNSGNNDKVIPDRERLPLPDVVGGNSLLRNDDGVIVDDDDDTNTLRPQMTLIKAASQNDLVRMREVEEVLPRPATFFGLPKTPQVSMGACFSQVLHDISLTIHCAASWIHPLGGNEYLLLGCEEGLFAIDLSRLHDAQMIKLNHRRCQWMHVHRNVLIALQGKSSFLYRHDLTGLTAWNLTLRISKKVSKVPEKFLPKMLAVSVRLPETRGCVQCCVQEGHGVDPTRLCVAAFLPTSFLLLQWYEPQSKFLVIRTTEAPIFSHPLLRPFNLVTNRGDYPRLFTGVTNCGDGHYLFDIVKFGEISKARDPEATLEASDFDSRLEVSGFYQLDRELIIFSYNTSVVTTDLLGFQKPVYPDGPSLFTFNFIIERLVVLPDSFLVFHSHGVEGRSLRTGERTQYLFDNSKVYRVIGNDKLLVLKTHRIEAADLNSICFLTGHTDTTDEESDPIYP